MVLPCLNPNASDFRGYPNLIPIDYWKTTASNPCSVNPSTFVYEPLSYNESDGKYYSGSSLANGKYFNNSDGNGEYKVIVNGVVDTTIVSVNYSCNRLANNEAPRDYFENILGGKKSGYDVYNSYILVIYSNLNIVVRYPTNQGVNPTGKIVAGELGKTDLGLTNNNYLGLPIAIKANSANGRFVVYSNGMHKSFKVFDINGNFLYKCKDSNSSSSGDLNYKTATETPAYEPADWNGLIGKLTYRDFGSSDAQQDQTINTLWTLEHMDFITTPSANLECIIVGIWNFNNTTKENKYEILSLNLFMDGAPFGTPTIVQSLYSITAYQSSDGNEMIPAVCVSKIISLGSTTDRVEFAIITPRVPGSNKNYGHRQITATASQTAISGSLPGFTGLSQIDLGSFSTGIGNQIFEGNLKAEIRKNSSGQLILNVNSYNYSKWAYNREILKQWWLTANVAGALVGLGFALTGLGALGTWGTVLGVTFTTAGVIGVVIGAVVTLVVYLIFKPSDRANYAIVIITPSSGSGTTTYTRASGHWISYSVGSGTSLAWLSMSNTYILLQTFCVQSGTISEPNQIYALKNSNINSSIYKGLATSKSDNISAIIF